MKTVGPHVTIQRVDSRLVCTRCDYLKHNLVRSGRDPQWECLCMHPDAPEIAKRIQPMERVWPSNMAKGCWIGEMDDTPKWCPELKGNKGAKDVGK